MPPLFLEYSPEVVKLLLEHGASIDPEFNVICCCCCPCGRCCVGGPMKVQMTIAGALFTSNETKTVNQTVAGVETEVQVSNMARNQEDILRLFLEYGLDPNTKVVRFQSCLTQPLLSPFAIEKTLEERGESHGV